MAKVRGRIGSLVRRVARRRLREFFRSYVLDEALAPFRHLGRRIAFGALGSLLIAAGSVICLVAILRVLQTETGSVFAGHWSFAPYLLTAVAGAAALGGFLLFGFRGLLARQGAGHGGRRRRA